MKELPADIDESRGGVIKCRNMFFLQGCASTFSGFRGEMCGLSTSFSMSFLISYLIQQGDD